MYNKVTRFVIWICSKFNRQEIEKIISELSEIIKNKNPEIRPKDDFKQNNPNYRNYFVDENLPLSEKSDNKKKRQITGNSY